MGEEESGQAAAGVGRGSDVGRVSQVDRLGA